MNLIIVGLNHKTAPVEIREKLAFPGEIMGASLDKLLTDYDVNEALIISTCNRVEAIGVSDDIDKGVWEIKRFLAEYHSIPLEELDENLYVHTEEDAVKHIFRVAAGLDSMVVGEPQILGQVKNAFSDAVHFDAAGAVIKKLFHKTFSVAKRIRTETNIGSSAVSISFAAVELAKKIFSSLDGKSAMLLGAGEMAELACKHLMSAGVNDIYVANRTFERAQNLAKDFDGTAINFKEYPHYLKDVDIVIASTGSADFVITPEQVTGVMKDRKYRQMFMIDISVPRNIDPRVNDTDNIYVYDIDDLQGVVQANMGEREKKAADAELIIDEEIELFYRWVKSLDVVPTIIELKKTMEEIRKGELEKAVMSLENGDKEGLDKKQLKILDSMTKAMMNKVLHDPVTHLKNEAHNVDGDFLIDAVRRLFDLDKHERTALKLVSTDKKAEGDEA